MARRRTTGDRSRGNQASRGPRRKGGSAVAEPVSERPSGPVELPAELTVGRLAELLDVSHVEAVKAVMRLGIMATVNQSIDFQTAATVAHGLGVQVRRPREREESLAGQRLEVDESAPEAALETRPPIVTILGHVDHGKTTLLDAIRGTQVVADEAGGITQSIGAYQADWNGRKITFIDTPGHNAFTAMRARGAQATDIAIILIAADDGVMQQTDEAIDHAKAAGVPMLIAINKVDAPGADVERVRRQLAEREILVEAWGGDVVDVEISALQQMGIDDLLENVLLVGEIENLTADPNRPGTGVVIESHVDKSRGPLAVVIVRSGTARVGDNVVAGTARGRIRDMTDGFAKSVSEAGPSTPIQIMGLSDAPNAGDPFDVLESDRAARQLVETRERLAGQQGARPRPTTMAEAMRRSVSGETKELNLVIKTASQGSVDAVRRSVEPLSTDEVLVNIVGAATGVIGETDVMLAAASDAIVIGFETFAQPGAVRQADVQGVEIRTYDVIYQLIDDVQSAVTGMLSPEIRKVTLGRATIQQVFPAGRRGKAAGIRVTDGYFARNARVRVLRDGEEVHSARIASLRRFKEDVREVQTGFEGGLTIHNFNEYEEGDTLECFEMQEFSR